MDQRLIKIWSNGLRFAVNYRNEMLVQEILKLTK